MNPRLYHASWGGMFAHPLLERDTFECLPYLRQREILAAMYGGSVPDIEALPAIPTWFKFYVPDSFSLACLLRRNVEKKQRNQVTPQELSDMMVTLNQHVTMKNLLAECTARGRGEKIRTGKPLDGIYAYVWRSARFNEGACAQVSYEALWDLEEGMITLTGLHVNFTSEKGIVQTAITNWLDKWALALDARVGGDQTIGTTRWGRALGLTL